MPDDNHEAMANVLHRCRNGLRKHDPLAWPRIEVFMGTSRDGKSTALSYGICAESTVLAKRPRKEARIAGYGHDLEGAEAMFLEGLARVVAEHRRREKRRGRHAG